MRPLLLLPFLAMSTSALAADEAVLSSDRPGVGESPGTPGVGFANVQGGAAAVIADGSIAPQTQAITVRVGIDRGLEVRAVLPDLILASEGVELGPLAAGFKVVGAPSERITLSAVPELLVALDGTGVGWRISSNAGLALGRLQFWLNATTTVLDGVRVFGGGGTSVALGGGGVYVNAGREVVLGDTLVGGGGWWMLSDKVQLDAGCDVWLVADDVVAVPMIGLSVAL